MSDVQIKLIPSELIYENSQTVRDIELLSKGLFKEIGWHYSVDLVWVIKNLQEKAIYPGATVLDAGAGSGLLQFLLAMYGYTVLSVDYSPRKMNLLVRHLFKFNQIINRDEFFNAYISHVNEVGSSRQKLRKFWHSLSTDRFNPFSFAKLELKLASSKKKPGRITLYQEDMTNLKEIPSNSIDAVVSVSAIEHMEKAAIKAAIIEFDRVLKNHQPMIITTSASKKEDWFHQPSKGWCFSHQTLNELFASGKKEIDPYDDFDGILKGYKENNYLQQHLASNYFISEKNGMPWGFWDPQYIPVGIIKF